MTIGMSVAWRSKQPKQKRCQRCNLYYDEQLDKCSHCAELNEAELAALKKQQHRQAKAHSILGSKFIFSCLFILFLLAFTF